MKQVSGPEIDASDRGAADQPAHERAPFWQHKTLAEMTDAEWESLCDGCGRCCLLKLEDEENGRIYATDVACRLLDSATCRCSSYENRHKIVTDCVRITPDVVPDLAWLPPSCAYRLIDEGRDLYWWHHLVSGELETVHTAGISVKNRTVPELEVLPDDLEDHLADWPLREMIVASPEEIDDIK